jgi:hypothetical protein
MRPMDGDMEAVLERVTNFKPVTICIVGKLTLKDSQLRRSA